MIMIDHINMQTIAAFDNWASTCLPTRIGREFRVPQIESVLNSNNICSRLSIASNMD